MRRNTGDGCPDLHHGEYWVSGNDPAAESDIVNENSIRIGNQPFQTFLPWTAEDQRTPARLFRRGRSLPIVGRSRQRLVSQAWRRYHFQSNDARTIFAVTDALVVISGKPTTPLGSSANE